MPNYVTVSRITLCLAAVATLGGCGESPAAQRRKAVVGTWYEDPALLTARTGSAARPAATTPRRHLHFNADGTFRLILCDPTGRPLSPEQSVAGTWRIAGETLAFKVNTTTLDAAHAHWVPQQGLDLRLGRGSAGPDYLDLRDTAGLRVRYGRTPPPPP